MSCSIIAAYLGIDIAKRTFDVALLREGQKPRHKVFANTDEGFAQLTTWLNQSGICDPSALHACMESTCAYERELGRFLHAHGYRVSVVNPTVTHAFSRCELSRTKTDKADAGRIARYCQFHSPRLWEPPSEELETLSDLVRRLEVLQQLHLMEHNRLVGGAAGAVKESLEAVLSLLDKERKTIERLIREHIKGHPELRRQAELLETIPGIGPATAAVLLAELGPVERFKSARQVAAFAGLAPRLYESGTSVRGRATLCKQGRSRLRKSLYFPAMSALRHNPLLRTFSERLTARGKGKMAILGAAMRKLLSLAFGVLKSGKRFDPAWPTADLP